MMKKMRRIVVLGILMTFGSVGYADSQEKKEEKKKILDSSYSTSVLSTTPETKFEVEVVEKDRNMEILLRKEIDKLKKEKSDLLEVMEGNRKTYDEMKKSSEDQLEKTGELESALDKLENEMDLHRNALERSAELSAAEKKSLQEAIADLQKKLEESWRALADFTAEVIAYRNVIRVIRLHGDTGVQLGYLKTDEETGQSVETIHVVRGADTAGRTFISYLIPYKNHKGVVVAAMKTLHLHFRNARKLDEGEEEVYAVHLAQERMSKYMNFSAGALSSEDTEVVAGYEIGAKAPENYEDLWNTLRAIGGKISRDFRGYPDTLYFVAK